MENAVWKRLSDLKEDKLRTEIIIPILERTPGLEQVTDVHGMNERGLDVIFFTVDHIRRTCYGVQIKRGDISGGGSRDRTVKQIIDQLDLATHFRHPVAIQPSGEYQIERFIVAANGRISATAREEIARRVDLNDIPDFWDLSEIIRRAKNVFPEVLQTADSELISYLKFVKARCETLDALDQISGIAHRTLSEVFVEPSLRRRFDPTLAESGSRSKTPTSHSIPALKALKEGHDFVLIGEQNEGKSAIVRMLAIQRVEALLDGDPNLEDEAQVPVMVRASQVISQNSLRTTVAAALRRGGASERAGQIEDGQDLSPYVVFVDGFSEIPDEEAKRRCERLIRDESRAGKPRIVVVGRPEDFLRPGLFDDTHHYTIQDFSQKQVRSLVRKVTGDTVEFGDVAEKMIDRVRDALQLPGSPIPAIIGVMLYEQEQKYITNTAEAVDRYMVIRLGRYATEMGVRMEVEWQRKQDLLAEVAFAMVTRGLHEIQLMDALELMDAVYDRLGEVPNSSVAVKELADAGVLSLREGSVSFFRTAFRDFFAAKRVASQHNGFDEFFERHLFDRRWGQVLVLAAGLRRHNSELLVKLNRAVARERSQLSVGGGEDYLYGAYLLGRILSNSDAAEVSSRLAILKTTVGAVGESVDALADEAVEQFGNIGRVVALIGSEQTMLITIGVPWLARQLRELSQDADLSDEERYLLMSVYVNLACESWMDVLHTAITQARNPRVVAALLILVHILDDDRTFSGEELSQWRGIKKLMERKRQKLGKTIDTLLEVKGPLLEIERSRMRRLNSEN